MTRPHYTEFEPGTPGRHVHRFRSEASQWANVCAAVVLAAYHDRHVAGVEGVDPVQHYYDLLVQPLHTLYDEPDRRAARWAMEGVGTHYLALQHLRWAARNAWADESDSFADEVNDAAEILEGVDLGDDEHPAARPAAEANEGETADMWEILDESL